MVERSYLSRIVYQRFGSKTGLIRYLIHWILSRVGVYRRFSGWKPAKNQRVIFICSGNICRSPLAEAYAHSLGRDTKSCGLDCTDGHPADPRAREFARKHDLNLDRHVTVNVNNFEFHHDDLIILMEPSHIPAFEKKVGGGYSLALAGSYCERPIPYIHDPFNCSNEFFENCAYKIMEAVREICD